MDGTESASEERDPTADDGTSISGDTTQKDGDDVGSNGAVPSESPLTHGQDAGRNGAILAESPLTHGQDAGSNGAISVESPLADSQDTGGNEVILAQSPLTHSQDVGGNGAITVESALTHNQDADSEAHTRELIAKYIGGGSDVVQSQEKEALPRPKGDEYGESLDAKPADSAHLEPKQTSDSPVDDPLDETGDQDGEPEHIEVENTSGINVQAVVEEDKDQRHDNTDDSVVAAKLASSLSSPDTKVSGVMSDPGDSFGSAHFDTGKESEEETDSENSKVAQSLVKEVLNKALMINSDNETSDQDLDGIAPADEPRADGTADVLPDDGKDGDRGNKDSKSEIDTSVDQSEIKIEAHLENGKLDTTQSMDMDVEEGDQSQVPETQGVFDESRPEAERVTEVRDFEDEDEGDYEAEGDGEEEEEVKLVCVGEGSPHPEYPMNYGNYKVCRQVAPGVKECLILETGEFIKYDRKKRISTSSLSPTTSPRKSDDDILTRRSLSESSGGSPRSDTEGEKKAFKIVKTPPAMKGTVFMSLKLGESGECNSLMADGDMSKVGDYTEEKKQVVQEVEVEDDTEFPEPNIQDDTHEGCGAEVEQVSDVLETSPEEVRSERKVIDVTESQESHVSQVSTKGILKSKQETDVPLYRSSITGSPVSPGKPPMSPRMRANLDQRERGHRSPPRRGVDDGGRNYPNVDQTKGSYTSDYGGSVNGSYLSGRQPLLDRGYHSMPTHDGGRAEHMRTYQPEVVTSPPSSGPVPGYNTLKDQQISWLKMFKLLEDEHRTELRAQYAEHQRMIQDIQDQMERELRKQQTSIQMRLDSHREILRDASPLADRVLSSLAAEEYRRPVMPITESYRSRLVDYSSGDSGEGEREELGNTYVSPQRSKSVELLQTAAHRSPKTDKTVPSYSDDGDDEYLGRTSTSLPVRRSLERAFDSPVRSPERGYVSMETSYTSPRMSGRYGESNLSRSNSDATGDRLLRGGVYSSPMPISKVKSAKRSSTSFTKKSFTDSHRSNSPPVHDQSSAAERPFEVRPRKDLSWRGEDSEMLTESVHDDSQLSLSTRVNLREKHAKHLSDLREYYEAELADLRSALSAAHPASEPAHERILRDENQELKLRCQELDDNLHSSKIRNRDLEQKLQGLEIRANDYSARYDESQKSLLMLRGRIDELHLYVKDKDNLCADLEAKVRQQTKSLQDAYKHQNELTESNRRDKEALKRLLDKYENLEKEHDITMGRVGDGERKLHSAHEQIAELNKTIAKLELHNKQLARENDTLKHKAAIAMNMASAKTSYEDSYGSFLDSHPSVTSNRREITHDRVQAPLYRSVERLYVSEPDGNRRVESSQESDDFDSDSSAPSPLLKAEQELRKRQNMPNSTQSFEPKLQKKFYGSENTYPDRYQITASTSALDSARSQPRNTSSFKTLHSPNSKNQARNMSRSDTHLNSVGSQNGIQSRSPQSRIKLKPKELSTPTRFDIDLSEVSNGRNGREVGSRVKVDPTCTSSTYGTSRTKTAKQDKSVENTLSRVRAGNFVSRPEWEDVDTSMAKPTKSQISPRHNSTREERLKERLQTVDRLERRYDELQAEKRKLESALNKIPIHGRNRKAIQSQEQIESGLEKVDKEIGSVRMSLKRFQVLKSTI